MEGRCFVLQNWTSKLVKNTGVRIVLLWVGILGITEIAQSAQHPTIDSELQPQTCVGYPENDANPPVEVCKTKDSYSFRILDDLKIFARLDFEERVSNAAALWLSSHNKESTLLAHSSVQIWMSVPESSPGAAQPRAIITTSAGRISFWFDLAADHWEFNDAETAILGEGNYPDSFGYRPLRILVKAQPGVPASEVEASLRAEGAKKVTIDGNGWYSAFSTLFDEKNVAVRAHQNHPTVINYAQVNSVVEWIADRQMAFYFTYSPQDDILTQ
jgi:hypothetical protein